MVTFIKWSHYNLVCSLVWDINQQMINFLRSGNRHARSHTNAFPLESLWPAFPTKLVGKTRSWCNLYGEFPMRKNHFSCPFRILRDPWAADQKWDDNTLVMSFNKDLKDQMERWRGRSSTRRNCRRFWSVRQIWRSQRQGRVQTEDHSSTGCAHTQWLLEINEIQTKRKIQKWPDQGN